jgi:hypothetical protein
MRYLIASLVVVDGMSATITSNATFGESEKDAVQREAANGLWPFFVPSGGPATNRVTFGAASGLKIETVVQAGNPLILGANVLGIARYLGHGAG